MKNASGEGSLRQRSDGLWEYRICVEGRKDPISFYSRDNDGRGAKKKYREWLQKNDPTVIEKVWTVKDWAAHWLRIKKSKVAYGTYSNYDFYTSAYIVPAIGKMKLDYVRPYHIEDLFASAAVVKLSPSAKNEIRVCLNGIFNTGVKSNFCRKNPVEPLEKGSVKKPKPPQFWTLDQVKRIIPFAQTHKWGNYVIAFLYTGLRTEELCALQPGDLHLIVPSPYIDVNKVIAREEPPEGVFLDEDRTKKQKRPRRYELRERTKGEENRVVAIHPEHVPFFQQLLRQAGTFIFAGLDGKPYLTPPQMAHRFGAVLRDLNRTLKPEERVPAYSPHKARHTYGSQLLDGGANIKAVADQLGHVRISTTQIYLHADLDMRGQAAAKLPY